jgi:hypothetical protein
MGALFFQRGSRVAADGWFDARDEECCGLARMARERAAQRRGSAHYCRMYVYLPKGIALEIENERRRYLVEIPSRSKVMSALFGEALAMRASLRLRTEQQRAEPWLGADRASPPPLRPDRKEERRHRRVNPLPPAEAEQGELASG